MKKDFMDYERPSVTADVVLLRMKDVFTGNRSENNKKLQVMLVKRKEEPDDGKWSLPGGFVGIDDTIENTARNKVLEKTGYQDFYLEQLYTFDKPNRDKRWRVISTAYIGIAKYETSEVKAENFESKWFDVFENELISENEKISFSELAFDHGEIICKAIERLQGKIFYSDIAFEFLPNEFTIRDLHIVFEEILQRKIDNFARTIKPKIEETGNVYNGKACRPAKLFRKTK